MIADFSCRVPHMRFGDFRNGQTTGLGHLQPLANDCSGAVRFGVLRGLEISGPRLLEGHFEMLAPSAVVPLQGFSVDHFVITCRPEIA